MYNIYIYICLLVSKLSIVLFFLTFFFKSRFFFSYPYPRMQPHELRPSSTRDPLITDEDLQSNRKARELVTAWQDIDTKGKGCELVGYKAAVGDQPEKPGRYPNLEKAIENSISFTKDEALKVKGKSSARALNIGYLDRLFVLVDDEITKVDRDLEVQAMLYGGDHLPQLFHVKIMLSQRKLDHYNRHPTLEQNLKIKHQGFDESRDFEPLLKIATMQLFTTTPELAKDDEGKPFPPAEEFKAHVGFGASDKADTARLVKDGQNNLRHNNQRHGYTMTRLGRSESTDLADSTDSTRGFLVTRSSNPNEED